jgi:hypothetical protein
VRETTTADLGRTGDTRRIETGNTRRIRAAMATVTRSDDPAGISDNRRSVAGILTQRRSLGFLWHRLLTGRSLYGRLQTLLAHDCPQPRVALQRLHELHDAGPLGLQHNLSKKAHDEISFRLFMCGILVL